MATASLNHWLLVAVFDVNSTSPPLQKLVALPAVITGTAGNAFTVVVMLLALLLLQPAALITWRLYLPDSVTVYVTPVALLIDTLSLNHWLPVAALEVKTTEPPLQKSKAPPAVMAA